MFLVEDTRSLPKDRYRQNANLIFFMVEMIPCIGSDLLARYQSLVVNSETSGRIYIDYWSIYLVSMRAQNTNWNKLRTIIIILLCHAKSLSYSPKRGAISEFELANFLTAANPRTLPEPCPNHVGNKQMQHFPSQRVAVSLDIPFN